MLWCCFFKNSDRWRLYNIVWQAIEVWATHVCVPLREQHSYVIFWNVRYAHLPSQYCASAVLAVDLCLCVCVSVCHVLHRKDRGGIQRISACDGFWLQLGSWANTATWRRFAHAVTMVTWSSWIRRCSAGCVSVGASRLMPTWRLCSSWTRPVSAALLTCSPTWTKSAPAGRPATSTCPTRTCTPSDPALQHLLCTWRPAILASLVRLRNDFLFFISNIFTIVPFMLNIQMLNFVGLYGNA